MSDIPAYHYLAKIYRKQAKGDFEILTYKKIVKIPRVKNRASIGITIKRSKKIAEPRITPKPRIAQQVPDV